MIAWMLFKYDKYLIIVKTIAVCFTFLYLIERDDAIDKEQNKM